MMETDEAGEGSSGIVDMAGLEALVDEHLKCGEYESAMFWAEKRLAIQSSRPFDEQLPGIARFMGTLTVSKNWHMIITFISKHDLYLKHLVFAFFYTKALFERQMFHVIVQLPLGNLLNWPQQPSLSKTSHSIVYDELPCKDELDAISTEFKYDAQLFLVLTRTYLVTHDRHAAEKCIRFSLQANPFSIEALRCCMDARLMSSLELSRILQVARQKNPSAAAMLKYVIEIRTDQPIRPHNNAENKAIAVAISDDLSVKSAQAFTLFSKGRVSEAYEITSRIMTELGYYQPCFLVHVSCLVELKKISELFTLGHKMVEMQPEKEWAWYAVGCYYYATGQYSIAKKFLGKATTINSSSGEAWIAYGHALLAAEEREQAMNCYLRASRILEGSFEPKVYIALEHCFASNYKLAWEFLVDAASVDATNAIILHEQGIVCFLRREYSRAESIFRKALRFIVGTTDVQASLTELLSPAVSDFWEPLFNNLGHTLRRLDKYEEAIEVHKKSLLLASRKAEAWGCIGICYAAMGDIDNALQSLNHALALKPGDEVLKNALSKLLDKAPSFCVVPSL